jgi:hypothetical protein
MDRSVGPPINRTARGGVDPIPLRLPPVAVASTSIAFSLSSRRSNLATVLLPRPPVQPPAPPRLVLAPPLRDVLLLHMRVKTLCHI